MQGGLTFRALVPAVVLTAALPLGQGADTEFIWKHRLGCSFEEGHFSKQNTQDSRMAEYSAPSLVLPEMQWQSVVFLLWLVRARCAEQLGRRDARAVLSP